MKSTVASSFNPNWLLLCSLSQILCFFPHFFWYQFPLTPCMVLSYFKVSTNPELTIAAPPWCFHSPISSPSLVLVHSTGVPIFLLISLTRKCAVVLEPFLSLVRHFQDSESSAISSFKEPLVGSSLFFPVPSTFSSPWFHTPVSWGSSDSPLCLRHHPQQSDCILLQTGLPKTPPLLSHSYV